jgi:(p)ppGpp synthase/HD superfamily hydrolase
VKGVKKVKISDFLKKVGGEFFKKLGRSHLSGVGKELVAKAVCFAAVAHFGQKRASGEDFVLHSIAVAELLLEIGRSAKEITAGVLHDVVEDTNVTLIEIEEEFGSEIAFLVDGMTKVFESIDIKEIEKTFGPQVAFAIRESIDVEAGESLSLVERDIIYRAKLFVMAQKDTRLVFVRLADRLHNTRTLEFLPVWKQKSVAEETLKFHLPLANLFLSPEELRLINPWLKELISLSHKYLQPDRQTSKPQRSTSPCLSSI